MISKVFRSAAVILLMSFLGISLCFGRDVMVNSNRSLIPDPDRALIVIMRINPSFGRALWTDDYNQSISIFDVSGEDSKLLGILKQGRKISYDVAPGEYTLMVVGESADFMQVTVAAGKTYYVLMNSRLGNWKARFSFRPLRQKDLESSAFAKWDAGTELVELTPEAVAWAEKHAADIAKKRERYWSDWTSKSAEKRAAQIMNVEDGRMMAQDNDKLEIEGQ